MNIYYIVKDVKKSDVSYLTNATHYFKLILVFILAYKLRLRKKISKKFWLYLFECVCHAFLELLQKNVGILCKPKHIMTGQRPYKNLVKIGIDRNQIEIAFY